MRKSQNGFTVVEGLLILVIVGLIGGTGWYVWHSKNNANEALDKANNINSNTSVLKTTKSTTNGLQELTSWASLPKDLQDAVLASYQKDYPGCLAHNMGPDSSKSGVAAVTRPVLFLNKEFADVGEGCDGGAHHLWVKVNGKWQDVEQTQLSYSCSTLDKYKIPKTFFQTPESISGDPYCYNADGTSRKI